MGVLMSSSGSPRLPRFGGLAQRITELIEIAQESPVLAVQSWLREMSGPASGPVIDARERGLRMIAEHGERTAGRDMEQFGRLLSAARDQLGKDRQPSTSPSRLGLRLTPSNETAGSRNHVTSTLPLHRPSPDLLILDAEAGSWSAEEWCQWLDRGFTLLREGDADIHLSFRPLRLYPLGNYIEQLAAAVRSAQGFGSPMRERLLGALQDRLGREFSTRADLDEQYWFLFNRLQPLDPTVSVGQAYVEQSKKMGLTQIDEEVLSLICDTAWECAATPSARGYFFDWLDVVLPSPLATASALASNLDEAVAEPELVGQTLPQAASVALSSIRVAPAQVISHLDQLITRGRLRALALEIGEPIKSVSDLNIALPRWARDTDPIWEPPEPASLSTYLEQIGG